VQTYERLPSRRRGNGGGEGPYFQGDLANPTKGVGVVGYEAKKGAEASLRIKNVPIVDGGKSTMEQWRASRNGTVGARKVTCCREGERIKKIGTGE